MVTREHARKVLFNADYVPPYKAKSEKQKYVRATNPKNAAALASLLLMAAASTASAEPSKKRKP